ncbi:hypothetical protein FG078_04895 [Vibrio cholerae]|uniref:hypothetical protein n=1 Tax=Vibrio cholerae TaxID=666 RepID=UPI0011DAFF4A|nr:hypothetical protein [Vibrio cholerae]EGR0477625.1 hypothetical protein [Vibrio cholerae]EGR0508413.1 hypothetical protein [Vibrio cholerae]EGR0892509.1 hypothetical protein [Vibrio cholerae]EGR1418178.1 hypothetical protein [Vibrio cholerae]EHV1353216.1 hypothetical protein [Vibrio cholerae]
MTIMAQLKPAGPLASLLGKMYGMIADKQDANRIYKELRPLLDDLLVQGHSFNSDQVQSIVNILRELPAYGVKRNNFEQMYLRDEYTLRKLPKDPNDIPYGYWH